MSIELLLQDILVCEIIPALSFDDARSLAAVCRKFYWLMNDYGYKKMWDKIRQQMLPDHHSQICFDYLPSKSWLIVVSSIPIIKNTEAHRTRLKGKVIWKDNQVICITEMLS